MITKKERAVLILLNNFNKLSKMKLVKIMFLMSEKSNFYKFVPYNYGPFSFELYHDLAHLEREGYISMEKESVSLINKDIPPLDNKLKVIVNRYVRQFSNFDDSQMIEHTYSKYPEYTIFSQIGKRMAYERDSRGLVTIGYEGKSIDAFLYELILNKVNLLVDVRKNAYSMKFGFHRSKLINYLEKLGIDYLHVPDLGIPSELRQELNTYEDYQVLFADYKKVLDDKGDILEKIKENSKEKKVALMCFEKDPKYCHRGVIADRLRRDGVEVCNL
ncbi:MAG TPA: DUF488 family protein [Candidatus Nanoarchaeia archaeon]|nr:DUF488 family protein [Candidatus Nanoarchaeia archaeon]